MKKLFKVVERVYESRMSGYRVNGSERCYHEVFKKEHKALECMHHKVRMFLKLNSDDIPNAAPALVLKTERRCVYAIVDHTLEEILFLDIFVEEFPVM